MASSVRPVFMYSVDFMRTLKICRFPCIPKLKQLLCTYGILRGHYRVGKLLLRIRRASSEMGLAEIPNIRTFPGVCDPYTWRVQACTRPGYEPLRCPGRVRACTHSASHGSRLVSYGHQSLEAVPSPSCLVSKHASHDRIQKQHIMHPTGLWCYGQSQVKDRAQASDRPDRLNYHAPRNIPRCVTILAEAATHEPHVLCHGTTLSRDTADSRKGGNIGLLVRSITLLHADYHSPMPAAWLPEFWLPAFQRTRHTLTFTIFPINLSLESSLVPYLRRVTCAGPYIPVHTTNYQVSGRVRRYHRPAHAVADISCTHPDTPGHAKFHGTCTGPETGSNSPVISPVSERLSGQLRPTSRLSAPVFLVNSAPLPSHVCRA
ncbi:hypothetical protein Bbelb_025160 [Branchiostoma belcheri]|nr:hypothetical protein Bbelb_025160 [Branchiostoma belcheri]